MSDFSQEFTPRAAADIPDAASLVSAFRNLIEDASRLIGVERPGLVHLFAALIDLPEAREMVACLGGRSDDLAQLLVTHAWTTPGDGGAEDVIRAAAPYAGNGEGAFRRRLTLEAVRLSEFHPDLQPILVASNLPIRVPVPEEETFPPVTGFFDPDDRSEDLDDFDFPSFLPKSTETPEVKPADVKPAEPPQTKKTVSSGDKTSSKAKMDEEAQAAVAASMRNLTEAARAGSLDPVVGRDREIAHIVAILQRRRKSSILLHGEAGVGKTSIAEGIAQALAGPDAPDHLAGRPFYEVALPALVAGARFRGDFEARMVQLIEQARAERAILFIDEIHMLIGSGSTMGRGMDGANILKPALARGEISIIGATTTPEMRVLREDAALMRRFDSLAITEPDRAATLEILARAGDSYLDFHRLDIAPGTYEEIVRISERYNTARRFPDKAFDLMDMACVVAREDKVLAQGLPLLMPEHARLAGQRLGLRLPMAPTSERRGRILHLEAQVTAQFPERAAAVKQIAAVLKAAEVLPERGAPAVLLLGPETAESAEFSEAFAKSLDRPFRKFDGAMFSDGLGIALLVGSRGLGEKAPPAGLLGEIAEAEGRPLLHFDRVERMTPEAQAVLAKLITQGHIQGGDGKLIDLSGAALFLSVTPEERGSFGFSKGETLDAGLSKLVIDELKRALLHRVTLSMPSETELMAVAEAELATLAARLCEAGYPIELGADLCRWLVAKGRKGGVAEIRRLVTTEIRDRVTAAVLSQADMSGWQLRVEDLLPE